MTDQEKSDHWASLASELGAELPAEPAAPAGSPAISQTEASRSSPLAEGPRRKAPRKPAAESPRPAADWNRLASELGIAVPEEPVVAEAAPPVEKHADAAATQVVVLAAAGDLLEQPADLGTEDRGLAPEEGPPSQGRGAPAEAEEKKSLHRRRKRRRKPHGQREGEAEQDEPRPSRAAVIGAQERVSASTDAEAETLADQTLAVSEAKHSQQRRSRRGSRKRKKSPEREEAVVAERSAIAEPEEEVTATEEEQQPEVTPSAYRHREAADDDRPRRVRDAEDKAGHRAIPTWEEAIGMIVTTNLEARAKKPNGGQPRGRNGGRGSKQQRGSGRRSSS